MNTIGNEIQVIQEMVHSRGFTAAVLALLLYDTILSLEDEVRDL